MKKTTLLMLALFIPLIVFTEEISTQPNFSMPSDVKGCYGTEEAKVRTVFSAEEEGGRFRAYHIKWRGHDVIVSDMFGTTDFKKGDTITFMVQNIEIPFSGKKIKMLKFMIIDSSAFIQETESSNKGSGGVDHEDMDIPAAEGLVNDFSELLTTNQVAELTQVVERYEKETSVEIAVVIMDSVPSNTTIDTYATALFNHWGIGKWKKNNGLLLLVDLKNRKVRFEVGLGLEPIISDELASEVLETRVIPRFKKGEHYQGLLDGVKAAIEILEK